MPPQFMKDLKTPVIDKDQSQKSGKFNGLEDDDMTDDELDEFDDEFKNGDTLKFKLEILSVPVFTVFQHKYHYNLYIFQS
ncbi:Hypothetical predicted protein [Olea europaea subsp. europaea]|uniref:Uncharacterized protein n=1 Tax=Olea europaea subsp. europaea TaxID=158383 RepID=A0A8S0UZ67_OLEEU|nr:Hypothetical predicted protein [Olea europaea subsp. europaea]